MSEISDFATSRRVTRQLSVAQDSVFRVHAQCIKCRARQRRSFGVLHVSRNLRVVEWHASARESPTATSRVFRDQSACSVCGIARTKSTITFCASDMHHNGRSRLEDLNRLRRSLCVRRQLTLSRHASELKPGLWVAYSARLMDHAAGGPSPKDDVESMFNE